MRYRAMAACLFLGGCATTQDPGQGGFIAGVAGIASGGYDARIEEREAEVDEGAERQAALATETEATSEASAAAAAELAVLEDEHATLKRRIVRLRSQLAAKNIELDEATRKRVTASIAAAPQGETAADKAAALRKAIADARALAETLAELAS